MCNILVIYPSGPHGRNKCSLNLVHWAGGAPVIWLFWYANIPWLKYIYRLRAVIKSTTHMWHPSLCHFRMYIRYFPVNLGREWPIQCGLQLAEARWPLHATVNCVAIGSANGLILVHAKPLFESRMIYCTFYRGQKTLFKIELNKTAKRHANCWPFGGSLNVLT